jgi:hypothetical protein
MSVRWAEASGDYSNPATWNGGTLPAVDDDIHAKWLVLELQHR